MVPVCPTCGEKFAKNPAAPGRLICRHCCRSYDEKAIWTYWHGSGYNKVVRDNFNYPAAAEGGLPTLSGELREEIIEADLFGTENDAAYEIDIDPFAEYEAQEDTFDGIPDYDFGTPTLYQDAKNSPFGIPDENVDEELGSKGAFAVLSAVVGLVSLIVSLIPVVGLLAIVPALLGMAAGRYSWKSLPPGSVYYAAAVFGTIACGLAAITAIVAVICGNQIISFLNSAFPSLFSN